MADYSLQFKTEPNERGHWYTSIKADNDKEAIQKVKKLLSNPEGKYYKPKLVKSIYKWKKVWEEGDK